MNLTSNYARIAIRYSVPSDFTILKAFLIREFLYNLNYLDVVVSYGVRYGPGFYIKTQNYKRLLKYLQDYKISYIFISKYVGLYILEDQFSKLVFNYEERFEQLSFERGKLRYLMEKVEREWELEDDVKMYFYFSYNSHKVRWSATIYPKKEDFIILQDYLRDLGCEIKSEYYDIIIVWLV